MITRFNYVSSERKKEPVKDFYKWTLEKKIVVITTNKDGSVGDYIEKKFWKKEKCSWRDFIDSYNLGSVSEQVINHIEKGTPLITAHTLPAGDYTKLEKGAEIKREMADKGITMDMLVSMVKQELEAKQNASVKEEKVEVANNG